MLELLVGGTDLEEVQPVAATLEENTLPCAKDLLGGFLSVLVEHRLPTAGKDPEDVFVGLAGLQREVVFHRRDLLGAGNATDTLHRGTDDRRCTATQATGAHRHGQALQRRIELSARLAERRQHVVGQGQTTSGFRATDPEHGAKIQSTPTRPVPGSTGGRSGGTRTGTFSDPGEVQVFDPTGREYL